MSYASILKQKREEEQARQRAEEKADQARQDALERQRELEREQQAEEERRAEALAQAREFEAEDERRAARAAAYRATLRGRRSAEKTRQARKSVLEALRAAQQKQAAREEKRQQEKPRPAREPLPETEAPAPAPKPRPKPARQPLPEAALQAKEKSAPEPKPKPAVAAKPKSRPKPAPNPKPAVAAKPRPQPEPAAKPKPKPPAGDQPRAARRAAARAEAARAARRAELLDRLRGQSATARAPAVPAPARPAAAQGRFSGVLSWLSVKGSVIGDESGSPFALRAVRYPLPPEAEPGARAAFFDRASQMGATAVCLPIAQDAVLYGAGDLEAADYLDLLDSAISAAASAGLYSLLTIATMSSELIADERLAVRANAVWDQDTSAAWAVLARRYETEPAVLFVAIPPLPNALGMELAAGQRLTLDLWRYWQLSALGEIRRVRPRGIVVVSACASDLSGLPLLYMDGTEPANLVCAAVCDPPAWIHAQDRYRALARRKPLLAFVYPGALAGGARENWYRGLLSSGLHLLVNDLAQLEGAAPPSLPETLGRTVASVFHRLPPPPGEPDWEDWTEAFRSPFRRILP